MPWPDAVRLIGIGLFSFVAMQAVVINLDVHHLRNRPIPPPRLLAWHIHAVSVYSIGMHGILAYVHARRIGESSVIEWHLWVLVILGLLGNYSLWLIGQVVRLRKTVVEKAQERLPVDES